MNKHFFTRASVALVAGGALAIGFPMAAGAHVTVDPGAAEAGSYTIITVKVPNESATAATNRVELSIPVDTPFASVRYVPVPGWTAELVRETLPSPVDVGDREVTEAVTTVIWTAMPGSEIQEGELQLFPLSVGPVPNTGSIVLAADQFYSDGEIVSWSEEGEDAEHPAPVLYVNDAPAGDDHAPTDFAAEPVATVASADDMIARVLAIGGLVLGAAGIVFGVTARRKAGNQ